MTDTSIDELCEPARGKARRMRERLRQRGHDAARSTRMAVGYALEWLHERNPHHRGVYAYPSLNEA